MLSKSKFTRFAAADELSLMWWWIKLLDLMDLKYGYLIKDVKKDLIHHIILFYYTS